ncbi:formylglycine-generating enzyme family protein [Halomonas eurihalina]|uniref:Formylglycine-generating enzyme family protein n=2 Tax=Halomonas eurihalina TaxID=42566 RepID=A0A5D9DCL4_HALER|nr:formylglycine-generating enzyme family protein [Halomonas eurihalina]
MTVAAGSGRHSIAQARIDDGAFWMGDAFDEGAHEDGETPEHAVYLDAFAIDITTVTNRDYAAFVAATGYVTDAEHHGASAVFDAHLKAEPSDVEGAFPGTSWWLSVRGADWRHPAGPLSSLEGIESHPVVHVSWNDAMAYCCWAHRQLPTEAQWERACRGGGGRGMRYPWGDTLDTGQNGAWPCNIWQGQFPHFNRCEDGWDATAPANHFAPNDYGLHQMIGNVWEWCADWFDARFYDASPLSNPRGPEQGTRRTMRGGSFLCHDSYCNRYRNSARSSNTPESSASNIGFRTVFRDGRVGCSTQSTETT